MITVTNLLEIDLQYYQLLNPTNMCLSKRIHSNTLRNGHNCWNQSKLSHRRSCWRISGQPCWFYLSRSQTWKSQSCWKKDIGSLAILWVCHKIGIALHPILSSTYKSILIDSTIHKPRLTSNDFYLLDFLNLRIISVLPLTCTWLSFIVRLLSVFASRRIFFFFKKTINSTSFLTCSFLSISLFFLSNEIKLTNVFLRTN